MRIAVTGLVMVLFMILVQFMNIQGLEWLPYAFMPLQIIFFVLLYQGNKEFEAALI